MHIQVELHKIKFSPSSENTNGKIRHFSAIRKARIWRFPEEKCTRTVTKNQYIVFIHSRRSWSLWVVARKTLLGSLAVGVNLAGTPLARKAPPAGQKNPQSI